MVDESIFCKWNRKECGKWRFLCKLNFPKVEFFSKYGDQNAQDGPKMSFSAILGQKWPIFLWYACRVTKFFLLSQVQQKVFSVCVWKKHGSPTLHVSKEVIFSWQRSFSAIFRSFVRISWNCGSWKFSFSALRQYGFYEEKGEKFSFRAPRKEGGWLFGQVFFQGNYFGVGFIGFDFQNMT